MELEELAQPEWLTDTNLAEIEFTEDPLWVDAYEF
jgi:hypothetical protein